MSAMRKYRVSSTILKIGPMLICLGFVSRVDMYAIQSNYSPHRVPPTFVDVFAAGTARDVSFLIDFLPSYVFPRDERTIVEWVVAGISLGGHSTWIALKNGTSTLLPPSVIEETRRPNLFCAQIHA